MKLDKTLLVIPCAGNGTRLIPHSLFAPKEFMPVPNNGLVVPAVLDLIWKAMDAGIPEENIIIVISEEKLHDFKKAFQTDRDEFAEKLAASNKAKFAEATQKVPRLKDEQFVLQRGPYGNATPLTSLAKKLAGRLANYDHILYMFPDDIFLTSGKNDVEQMLEAGQEFGGGIFAAKHVLHDEEYDKYGIVDGDVVAKTRGQVLKVRTIVEKPGKDEAPSDLASVSGYLLPVELLAFAEQHLARHDELTGEFMIQPIIQTMIDGGHEFFALKINGDYHDTGNFSDFAKLWSSIN